MGEQMSFLDEEEPLPDVYPAVLVPLGNGDLRLVGVQIDGLKGFDRVEVELQPLTVLTGPNNSGKTTVLQAIALAFDCFRRCLDTDHWTLRQAGRAIVEFDFLPVNEPKDLWYKRIWKPSRDRERYVRVGLAFSNGFQCVFRVRFLFGAINVGLESASPSPDAELLKSLVAFAPVLLPATPGPGAHEAFVTLPQVHRLLNIREPSRVLRNILYRLQVSEDQQPREFVDGVLRKYFGVGLNDAPFNETLDLEIRAPISEEDYVLDVVSAGSGLNQMLQLAAIIAWRKPGLVLLDEPDAHLHTSVQMQLLDFLTTLVDTYHLQVVLATHSRDLISQAPLHSIVPVDRTRSRLVPLASLEHLLLEYQRQGTVTNVDLALLYQTKRCVFVEGPTDARLLPRIAERLQLPLFTGRDQLVPFDFGGVDKISLLPDLARLFERLIGSPLRWGVIRDSDANVPEVKEQYARVARELGIPFFHQWSRYSLENYLLEPELLLAAAQRKKAHTTLTVQGVREALAEAAAAIEDDVSGVFITKTQIAYRDFQLHERHYEVGASAASRYIRSLTTLEQKVAAFPGKRMFGAFVEILQSEFGINLRVDDVVAELTPQNAPAELMECLTGLQAI